MKYLLDTHILLWLFSGDERLSEKARLIIADDANEIYYSLVSVWEVEIKHLAHPDKISMSGERFLNHCQRLGFIPVSLNVNHILALKTLTRKENSPPHRNPFDRIMICQAIVEDMTFITRDDRIAEYVSPIIYKI
ncbi:MAG: type II toxin-antitoxin system VapC family toxin [Selenomonadaceae bacterium]|nr:type II toxin-antitoxin system VapC family toxin [Selenomonadaceae bacterium]